jgi:nitroreductase
MAVDICSLPGSLRFLLSRSSVAPQSLISPGPNAREIQLLIAAALTAPDHAALRPWRFIVIEGDGRQQLSRTAAEVRRRRSSNVRPAQLAMTWKKALRSPTLVAVIARLDDGHPKVPLREQYISVGAAIHGLLLGAHALGYGAMMLSGNRASDPRIHALFELAKHEQMIGFIGIGTPSKKISPKVRPAVAGHLQVWHGDGDYPASLKPWVSFKNEDQAIGSACHAL